MKIKKGDVTIKVPTLQFLIQCLFSDPEVLLRRLVESHEYAEQQAGVNVTYAFVRKDFIEACTPESYRMYGEGI